MGVTVSAIKRSGRRLLWLMTSEKERERERKRCADSSVKWDRPRKWLKKVDSKLTLRESEERRSAVAGQCTKLPSSRTQPACTLRSPFPLFRFRAPVDLHVVTAHKDQGAHTVTTSLHPTGSRKKETTPNWETDPSLRRNSRRPEKLCSSCQPAILEDRLTDQTLESCWSMLAIETHTPWLWALFADWLRRHLSSRLIGARLSSNSNDPPWLQIATFRILVNKQPTCATNFANKWLR